ncbi:hypothetical protein OH805_20075 [Streptomyces sp. NBC_00879]|uniref:hypothetical protein n=1 Tax=Streptomyces sp. NBC_00879 TaxID=2975855 RepID=UPI00386356D3|nr:hypothetical protein OH805_20075 [Streptomyces sp. NBC_00879]
MGIEPNPYVPPVAGGFVPRTSSSTAVVRDAYWWVAPALCAPLVLLMAYADILSSGMPLDHGLTLGYLVPLAMVAASLLPERTMRRRPTRVTLGLLACCLAFFYSKLVMLVAIVVFLVLLLTGNVQV